MRGNVIRIGDLLGEYKSYIKFKCWYEENGDNEYSLEYNSYGVRILRELVTLKNKYPKWFFTFCFLKKIKLF